MAIARNKKIILALTLLSIAQYTVPHLTYNAKNDPFPVFTTIDPHTFLHTQEKLILKGMQETDKKKDRFGFSITPFAQNADTGKDIVGNSRELGDLQGRWGMIALTYGAIPAGQTLAPALANAQANLKDSNGNTLNNDPHFIDCAQEFGFFSFPLKYRKKGVRFETDFQLGGDFGLKLQAGIVDICQTTTTIPCRGIDLTTAATFPECTPTIEKCNVKNLLMDHLKDITNEIGLDIGNFHEVSVDDIRFSLYWRHSYPLNEDEEGWPQVLFTPYFIIGGSVDISRDTKACKAFALPFGNNGHHSVGATIGKNFDFYDTIEIGAEIGVTNFFKKDCVEMFVPNNECQTTIFPFKTNARFKPGYNWHFAGKIAAYHFVDRLSFFFHYFMVNHQSDDIDLHSSDSAFLPCVLEERSTWKVKAANIGFNYDISPNFTLGFLWQAPFSQRNVYRSTSILFSCYAHF